MIVKIWTSVYWNFKLGLTAPEKVAFPALALVVPALRSNNERRWRGCYRRSSGSFMLI
jgi:hypothetical protein